MTELYWWGYRLKTGEVFLRRYFDDGDIQEAKESDFVSIVTGPFAAYTREVASQILQERFSVHDASKETLSL